MKRFINQNGSPFAEKVDIVSFVELEFSDLIVSHDQ